jgi:outer membrane protein assembly complex protein YaeT
MLLGFLLILLPSAGWPSGSDSGSSDQTAYQVVFEGNQNLSSTKLRRSAVEELAAFEKQGLRRSDIDDAAYQMKLAYLQGGYAFAEVDYHIRKQPKPVKVTFLISEGPRVVIKEISFAGNQAADEKTLQQFFESRRRGIMQGSQLLFVESDMDRIRAQIEDLYLSKGFLNVQIFEPEISFSDDRKEAYITLSIHEGPQYHLREVNITGDRPEQIIPEIEKVRNELIDQPYVRRAKIFLRSRLLNVYQDAGYAYSQIDVNEKPGDTEGDILLEAGVNTGPLVTISEIDVRGNKETRQSFILGRLRFQPGDRYSKSKKHESFRALHRTGLFSKVDLSLEPLDDETSARLVVQVVEAASLEFYVEPGWGSYEKLRLKVGLRERSLLGTGIMLNPEAKISVKAQSLTLRFTDPWFLNRDITADLPMYYSYREEPSFTREDLGFGTYFSKDLSEPWKTTVGYNLRVTELSDVAPEALELVSRDDYNLGSIEAQVTYDTRDDIFFPLQGSRFFLAAERGDKLFGGDITFWRFTGGLRLFFRLLPATVLGMRYKSGLLIPGSDEIGLPISERFFNGGESTVRSYRESELGPQNVFGEPVGGYGYNVFNIELRQRIYGNFIGTLFVDVGNVAPNLSRSEQGLPPYTSSSDIISDTLDDFFSGMRPGVGIGLQYLLPIGPLRLDLAYNPDANEERGEDEYVIHFSVGTAF